MFWRQYFTNLEPEDGKRLVAEEWYRITKMFADIFLFLNYWRSNKQQNHLIPVPLCLLKKSSYEDHNVAWLIENSLHFLGEIAWESLQHFIPGFFGSSSRSIYFCIWGRICLDEMWMTLSTLQLWNKVLYSSSWTERKLVFNLKTSSWNSKVLPAGLYKFIAIRQLIDLLEKFQN